MSRCPPIGHGERFESGVGASVPKLALAPMQLGLETNSVEDLSQQARASASGAGNNQMMSDCTHRMKERGLVS
jgi:hypothetical protein